MTDMIDRANEHYEFLFEKSLNKHRDRFSRPSNTHCEECDTEIPEPRRKLGGVKYCIDCQTYLERKGLV